MLQVTKAEDVIDHGLSLGADFAELFVERSLTNAISTLSSQVQSVESGIDFGIGVRLVFGSKVLYGYTNKTEAEELKRIMGELAAMDLRDPSKNAIRRIRMLIEQNCGELRAKVLNGNPAFMPAR